MSTGLPKYILHMKRSIRDRGKNNYVKGPTQDICSLENIWPAPMII